MSFSDGQKTKICRFLNFIFNFQEIERLLFDNREIKEQARKTQRELSKEINSLTGELKDERDRIHELQKENRKLRQEVN